MRGRNRRKKFLRTSGIVLLVAIGLTATGVLLFRAVVSGKFVPDNLLEAAPDRISDTIEIDLTDPLQKQVTGGVIIGYNADTEDVQIYRGIPYAAPPVAELRWKAPQDVVAWEGVRECFENAPNPIQGDNEIKPGEFGAETVPDPEAGYSEDCLYLNIWTNGTGTNMPVVFYIPGGAWVGGGCSVENYDGEYLASQNVVFVSINYRLGIFGWLAADVLADEDAENSTGNYGLMDIIKALEWVQENISEFGGNPDNITLYGGSAGGNLIDLLMVSPKAEGLFHKAVSMSYPLDMISPAWDKNFKTDLGNKVIPDEDALEKLRNTSVNDLMCNLSVISAYAFSGPTLDGVYLDMTFAEAVAQGRGAKIDYIAGFNYNDAIPLTADGEATGDAAFVAMLGGTPDGATDGDVLRTVYNALAGYRAKASTANTYLLQFSHPTASPEQLGAVHGGDVQYMLNYFSFNRADYWAEDDFHMGKIASAYFINFCRNGNPNGDNLPEWEQSGGNGVYFEMNLTGGMKQMDADKTELVENFMKQNPDCTIFD
ncbi:MAG: carboxylesterase family protein [Lachnospiraceae bacterium]|nr:carboxylesterase family protein [Lachnospiraceae bacterium]